MALCAFAGSASVVLRSPVGMTILLLPS